MKTEYTYMKKKFYDKENLFEYLLNNKAVEVFNESGDSLIVLHLDYSEFVESKKESMGDDQLKTLCIKISKLAGEVDKAGKLEYTFSAGPSVIKKQLLTFAERTGVNLIEEEQNILKTISWYVRKVLDSPEKKKKLLNYILDVEGNSELEGHLYIDKFDGFTEIV